MRLPAKPVLLGAGLLAAGLYAASIASADEIKLKDGKKLYGVIVGYEDNMFRVKTDFGFVLVEKDKIASIVPAGPGGEGPVKASSKPAETKAKAQPPEAAAGSSADATGAKKISDAPVKPSLPASTAAAEVSAP